MLISIIIPTLNEEEIIGETLQSIRSLKQPVEIIVVDGGSIDNTVSIASAYATVIESQKGRAIQMNRGAEAAHGDVVLFLHADTTLPIGSLSAIRTAMNEQGYDSGAFRLRFDKHSPLLNFYSYCTRFKQAKLCFGDRAIFVKKDQFQKQGGFKSIPIFEDIELVSRLEQEGAFVYLPLYVTTAARRFEQKGAFSQQLLNTFLWIRYMLGASPNRLAEYYKYPPL